MFSRASSGRIGRRLAAVATLIALVFSTGCGGGGGGSAPLAPAVVTATSFVGYPLTSAGGLVPVYRNEVIEITFSRAIDAGNFGGPALVPGTSTPVVMTGRRSSLFGSVDYRPFANQAAARDAVRLWDDGQAAPLTDVVIGLSVADPKTIVIDPSAPSGNTLGLSGTLGFQGLRQIDVDIPAGSELRAGGVSVAAFGAPPPVTPPAFSETPALSTLFLTSAYYVSDNAPPAVTEITTVTLNGADPAVTPIAADDVIRIRFSEPIAADSIAIGFNLIVRNTSVTNTANPLGLLIVPIATLSSDAMTLYLTPTPSFGPGPYQIEVAFPPISDPALVIRDLPSGAAGVQTPLVITASAVFTTIPTPQAVGSAAISEDFVTTAHRDLTFNGRYNNANWNTATQRLEGLGISGSAQPGQPLGTRVQYTINPSTPAPVTAFFSPFDATGLNNFGATVNPNGGSHSQFLYAGAAPEIPNGKHDTIELVEWGAAFNFGSPMPYTFNGFTMKLSHATGDPLSSSFGLVTVFGQNYDFDNPQNAYIQPTSHPGLLPLNEAPITVVPSQPYVVPTLASTFVPFPSLTTLFDWDDGGRTEVSVFTNTLVQPSLLVDIDIPAPVAANNNFILGNFPLTPVPVRRINAQSGGTLAFNSDNVTAHMRFTFVGRNSSARSTFYDAGIDDPTFTAFYSNPAIAALPAGTIVTVKAEAGDAVSNNQAVTVGQTAPSGLVTLIDRYGVAQPAGFAAVSDRRYIRLTFELEANTATNARPYLEGFLLGYSF